MKAQKKIFKKVVDKIECAVIHFGGRGLSPGGMKRFASHKQDKSYQDKSYQDKSYQDNILLITYIHYNV